MKIGVLRETRPDERRVALVPAATATLRRQGHDVHIEEGAGLSAGFRDEDYAAREAHITSRDSVLAAAEVLLFVNGPGSWDGDDLRILKTIPPGRCLIGMFDPLSRPAVMQRIAAAGADSFALELMPRITRAQAMDVLSSMATVAGYKAVLTAADAATRMFPLLMTAAGTVTPARVLVIGAGVAGLQAIATARRLGALVQAYDVRPAVREQVESLGAKFVELPLATEQAEGQGGYARAMDEEFYHRQQALMIRLAAEHDVIITTAAVPGRTAPVLIGREAVEAMKPDSIIIDLAAERGGNCALTRRDAWREHQGVRIYGPVNLPSAIPLHASQLYAQNLVHFVQLLARQSPGEPDLTDPIIRETLVTHGGGVVHPRVLEAWRETAVPTAAATGEPAAV